LRPEESFPFENRTAVANQAMTFGKENAKVRSLRKVGKIEIKPVKSGRIAAC